MAKQRHMIIKIHKPQIVLYIYLYIQIMANINPTIAQKISPTTMDSKYTQQRNTLFNVESRHRVLWCRIYVFYALDR